MIARIVALVLILIILIGGGVLVYRFFKGPAPTNVSTITINKDGKFDTTSLKIANNENIRFKNNDNTNHTIKKSSDNSTLADVQPGQTTREFSLNDNTKYTLYLASNTSEKTTVTVGNPPTTTANTNPTPAPTPRANTATSSNQPLPNTGPGDNYLFFVAAFAGFALYQISKIYWKFSHRKVIRNR